MRTILLIILMFISPFILLAQGSLEKGIDLLNQGQFSESLEMFNAHLKTEPSNRTALICKVRALGLSGESMGAKKLLDSVIEAFGSDKELLLNKAEIYMWLERSDEAVQTYRQIEKSYGAEYSVFLGLANGYSASKKHSLALYHIDKAISIKETETAIRSKKFIALGYADSLLKNDKTQSAFKMLKDLAKEYKNDALVNMALGSASLKLKKWARAHRCYSLAAVSDEYKATAYISGSYAFGKVLRYKKAKAFAKKAFDISEGATKRDISRDSIGIQINMLYTLLNSGDRKKAFRNVEAIKQNSVHSEEQLLAFLRVAFQKGDIKEVKETLNLISQKAGKDLHALSKAEYYLFLDDAQRARAELNAIEPGSAYHAQAKELLLKIDNERSKTISAGYDNQIDNGDNRTISYHTQFEYANYGRLKPIIGYTKSILSQEKERLKRETRKINAGLEWNQSRILKLKGEVSSFKDLAAQTTVLLYDFSVKPSLNSQHFFDLGFNKKIYDYNVSLLDQNLVLLNSRFSYQYNGHSNIGCYVQFSNTKLSDGNNKSDVYGSLFYSFSPVFKAGVNIQNFKFSYSTPESYFSPIRYNLKQAFISYNSILFQDIKLGLKADIRLGWQKIENDPNEFIYALDFGLVYKPSAPLSISAGHSRSTVSGINAIGYSVEKTELAIRFRF